MGKVFKPIEIIKPYLRNGQFPIDSTTLFFSYNDAVEYAHNNPSAYATQIIGVDDEDNKITALYKIDYDETKRYRYVLSPIGVGNSMSTTMFNLRGSVDVRNKTEFPPKIGDENVSSGMIKTSDTEIEEGKIYYTHDSYMIASPNPEYISTYYQYYYKKTSDVSLTDGKQYYILIDGVYSLVEEPNLNDINSYYESYLDKASLSNISYVKTTDIAVDTSKQYYTKTGKKITAPIDLEIDSYYEKVFTEDIQYYGYMYVEVQEPNQDNISNYYETGLIDNRTELPDIANNGDMYYVKQEGVFYIAFENSDESISWAELTLHVNYASPSNDGIITKEQYSTFVNSSAKDSVWFSKSNNPEENSWIEVAHTTGEESRAYKITSEGRVKEMVTAIFGEAKPYITLTSDIETSCAINTRVNPKITVRFYQEFGGEFDHIAVYKIIDEIEEEVPFYSATPDYPDIVPIDGVENAYMFTFSDTGGISLAYPGRVQYHVVVKYLADEAGDVPAGECEETITFNFYNTCEYGTNLSTSTTLLDGSYITLTINPREETEAITKLFIKLPYPYHVEKILYTQQNDFNAIDLFTASIETINNISYVFFTYELGGNLSFKSPAEYIFFPIRDSEQFII